MEVPVLFSYCRESEDLQCAVLEGAVPGEETWQWIWGWAAELFGHAEEIVGYICLVVVSYRSTLGSGLVRLLSEKITLATCKG